MTKAIYKGMVRELNGYTVHLFYEYKGHEYMITDEHNGYSETIRTKHEYEQNRIDELLKVKEKQIEGEHYFDSEEIFSLLEM